MTGHSHNVCKYARLSNMNSLRCCCSFYFFFSLSLFYTDQWMSEWLLSSVAHLPRKHYPRVLCSQQAPQLLCLWVSQIRVLSEINNGEEQDDKCTETVQSLRFEVYLLPSRQYICEVYHHHHHRWHESHTASVVSFIMPIFHCAVTTRPIGGLRYPQVPWHHFGRQAVCSGLRTKCVTHTHVVSGEHII